MPITIINNVFSNSFGYTAAFYKSNAGDQNSVRFQIKESIEVVSGSSAYLTRNPIDNIVTWTGGDWALEGFRVGDEVACIKYDSNGNVLFAWNADIISVNGDQLDLSDIQTWIDATNGQIIRIVALRKREGLVIDVNHVSNGQTGSEYSVIDNEVTRFTFDIFNSTGTVSGVAIGNQSGQYVIEASLDTLEDNLEYREYRLSIDFVNSGIDTPSLFATSNCIKLFVKFRWQTLLYEPSNNTIQTYNADADTGWFNQPYNSEVPRSVLVQGISNPLDYTSVNSVSVVVELINGGNDILGVGGSYLPTDDQYYKNQTASQNSLSIVRQTSLINIGDIGDSYSNPDGAYWSYEITDIVDLGSQQFQIDIDLTFTTLTSFMDSREDGDRKFILWLKADNVNHVIYEEQLIKALPVGGPLDMKQNRFLYHNQNVDASDITIEECEANIEDDIAFSGMWLVPVGSVIDNVVANIECYNGDTEDSFVLGSVTFDFTGIPLQSGMYPVNLEIPVIMTLPNTSMKLIAKLFRDDSFDTSSEYGIRILFPFFLRWEYWLQQLNASGDFFPNQTKNWYPYDTGLNDWNLRYRMTSDIDGLTYNFNDDIIMKNYDSDNKIDQDIQLYLNGANVQVVTEGLQMEVEATHTVTTGEVWDQATVWGMITVEPKQSAPRSICSTVVPYDNDSSNPLTPFAGSLLCELTFPAPEIAVMRCNFDPDKIDLTNGVKFTTKIKGCFQPAE
jgi:hypothetical protein